MSSVTVDELVMRLDIEMGKFQSQATQAEKIDKNLRKSLKDTEKASGDTGKQFDKTGKVIGKTNEQLTSNLKAVAEVGRRFVQLFGVLAGSTALHKLADQVAKANDQLNFLSQRLNMSASRIRGMDAAVAALGGSGASAQATMRQLNQDIQEMVLMGNDALIPFFSALGVGVVDASGDIRAMDDILLDMADSLSQMRPEQAYAFAQAMGLDEGTTNALLQGRDALQDMLDTHKSLYVSTKEELAASRELVKVQAIMSARWDGLKTILGNAVIPLLTKMASTVSGWLDYLNRNERTVKSVFEGLAIVIGVVLLPVLAKAAVAMFALLSPVLATAAAAALLGAAFVLLYDDYQTWARGGQSMFDWGGFIKYFNDAEFSVKSLADAFVYLLTGYKSWDEARNAFSQWLMDKGIIDEYGLSLTGLGKAFIQLGKDIYESVPPLRTLIEMIGALMEGRWSDAGKLAARFTVEYAELGVSMLGAAAEHIGSAVDIAAGYKPGEKGTLSGSISALRERGANFFAAAKEGMGFSGNSGAAETASPLLPLVSPGALQAANYFSRTNSFSTESSSSTNSNSVSVSIGQVSVQTTASTLPAATAAGIASSIEQSGDLINQIGGGI